LPITIALSSFWDVFQVVHFLFDKPVCLIAGFPADIAPGKMKKKVHNAPAHIVRKSLKKSNFHNFASVADT